MWVREKLINLDTSSQAQSHLPLILPLKLGHTWEFTHLLSRSSTQTHKRSQTHRHVFPYTLPGGYLCCLEAVKVNTDWRVVAATMNKIQVSKGTHATRVLYAHPASQKHEYSFPLYWHWIPYKLLCGRYFIFSVSSPVSFSHTLANPHLPCWCLIRIFMC